MREIRIFHAGSMRWFLQQMANKYQLEHPDICITLSGSGARFAARKVLEGNSCDLLVSADYRIIEDLLKPEYAKFNLLFAKTKLVLSFTEKSRYHTEINENNWYEILLRPDVQYGHTDPELDPAGYRALLCWQLAEKYYNQPQLYQRLMDHFSPQNLLTDSTIIRERMHAGELDYFFGYEASARQRKNLYINLPSTIDFSTSEHATEYLQAKLTLNGKQAGTLMTVNGYPIQYSITLLEQASQREEAIDFLSYLLTQGSSTLETAGFIPLPVQLSTENDALYLPQTLQKLFK